MPFRHLVWAAAMALAPAAHGHSLSVEDIRAQIAAERDAPNPYAELLADPDPQVARRAMPASSSVS